MKTHLIHRTLDTTDTTHRTRKLSVCLQSSDSNTRRLKRVSFPMPRRETCLTRRAMRAALCEAEFYDWLNGDDFSYAMHQSIH